MTRTERSSKNAGLLAMGSLSLVILGFQDVRAAAACPVTVVQGDGTTNRNERAPNANFRFGRAVYLMTVAELTAGGFTNGTVPSAIGWRYATAPGVAAVGTLVAYLQNTSDTTNLKSTSWGTAITGMTVVHDSATTTLPDTTAPFDITFTGGAPFTYTGGAVYVAFDWQWAGPVGVAALVSTNTLLTGGIKSANGTVSPPTTLVAGSNRPETRLTSSVGTVFNDASVDVVASLGSLPLPFVGPQSVQAIVTNRGAAAINNLPVTFTLTGAETFADTQLVPTLLACGGQETVTFAPFTPGTIGSDTVTVSVPADDVAGNDTRSKPMDETYSLYSYKYPGSIPTNGVGSSGGTIDLVAKFTTAVAAKISAVELEFPLPTATTYRVAIYPDSGSGTPGLVPIYEDPGNRTVATPGSVTIALPFLVPVGPGSFFAGIQQTNLINAALSYDAEVPIRAGAFYFAAPHPATAWNDFAPGNNYKVNIGVTLVECQAAAECDDGNPCTTGDACASGACVGTLIAVPSETGSLTAAADKIAFDWTAASSAAWYEVARGSLSALPVGPGDGDEVCFGTLAGTSLNDPAVPSSGNGFWYLARGSNACGSGTYGTRSNGSPRSTTSCP